MCTRDVVHKQDFVLPYSLAEVCVSVYLTQGARGDRLFFVIRQALGHRDPVENGLK